MSIHRRDDFARVEDVVRVQSLLDPLGAKNGGRTRFLFQEAGRGDADPVLAGQRSPQGQSAVGLVENGHHRFLGRRQRDQLERNLVEHSPGALRSYEKTGQVVAGGALYRAGSGFDRLAVDVEK